MKRPTILLIITLLAAHALTGAEAAYVVAGEIAASDGGSVYIELVTEETFGRNGTSPYRIVLEPAEGGRSLAFRFDSIPPGRYVLRAFQDENGDGRLNVGPFGPREPVGMHRWPERMRIPPRFEASAFAVDGDMTDIRIELQ
ncbi:MAG: DUF2141 domain-containing protein [Spirochaetales bacterium]|nr:DUF2141 domain-containing protein [Spirochaetales bacterium]